MIIGSENMSGMKERSMHSIAIWLTSQQGSDMEVLPSDSLMRSDSTFADVGLGGGGLQAH